MGLEAGEGVAAAEWIQPWDHTRKKVGKPAVARLDITDLDIPLLFPNQFPQHQHRSLT